MSIAQFFMLIGAVCAIAFIVIVFLLWLWDDREDVKAFKSSVRKLHHTVSRPFDNQNSSGTKPGSRFKKGEGCFADRYRCFDCGAENLSGEDCWNCAREDAPLN